MANSSENTLFEEKKELMVSPNGGNPSRTIAHFLNPSFPTSENVATTQDSKPQLSMYGHLCSMYGPCKLNSENMKFLSSKVIFNGWSRPSKEWISWVEKMRPLHQSTWEKCCIYEPIMASTLYIPRCYNSVFVVAERFCAETNSFIFPWGEATVTLEDIMVLGGYSVTGESVLRKRLPTELLDIEEELHNARMELVRTKAKSACQSKWMQMWKGRGGDYEHEAFLSYWLSRYVFPADNHCVINKSVFQVAVVLARGDKVALAPAVLASMYRDLRMLKEKIGALGDYDDENVARICVWAPLQLLQAWIWERFPTLSPKANCMSLGLPRIARWSEVQIFKGVDDVSGVIDSASESFKWRPYATPLKNWSSCKLYLKEGGWVSIGSGMNSDFDFESYIRCVRTNELVGLDCLEHYLPHRVSMQFGLDQDIPRYAPRLQCSLETAWSHYNRPTREVKLYVPPRLFESDVTMRYLRWWKSEKTKELDGSLRIKKELNEAAVPPGFYTTGRPVAKKPTPRGCRASLDGIETRNEKKGEDAAQDSCEIIELSDDEDDPDNDDHRTLSQVFHLERYKRENTGGSFSMQHSESPLSSAGDNSIIPETNPTSKHTKGSDPNEGNSQGLDTEDRTERTSGNQVQSPDNNKRTLVDDPSDQPVSKRSMPSVDDSKTRMKSKQDNAAQGAPRIVDESNDSQGDDQLPLAQPLQLEHEESAFNGGQSESPLSFAGDSSNIQVMNSTCKPSGSSAPMAGSIRGFSIQEKFEIKQESPVQSPEDVRKSVSARSTLRHTEYVDELTQRVSRLQRLLNMLKAGTWKQS